MRKRLNQTVIVENVGGAGGTLGAAKVAAASPDGYTLLVHHIGYATAPTLYRKLPYKGIEDFAYLGLINEAPSTLIGRTTLPARRAWVTGPCLPGFRLTPTRTQPRSVRTPPAEHREITMRSYVVPAERA